MNQVLSSLKAGDLITPGAVKSIRPGYGIAPKYLDSIIGSAVKQDIETGTAVTRDLFD